jgi:hypothetical protein
MELKRLTQLFDLEEYIPPLSPLVGQGVKTPDRRYGRIKEVLGGVVVVEYYDGFHDDIFYLNELTLGDDYAALMWRQAV